MSGEGGSLGFDPYRHADGSRECRPVTEAAVAEALDRLRGRFEGPGAPAPQGRTPARSCSEALSPSKGGGNSSEDDAPDGAAEWDKRPGAFDAARGAPPLVFGAREADGWKVALTIAGGAARLTPGEARALAAELVEYADTVEFGWEEDPSTPRFAGGPPPRSGEV